MYLNGCYNYIAGGITVATHAGKKIKKQWHGLFPQPFAYIHVRNSNLIHATDTENWKLKPTISLYVHNYIMLVHYISTAHVWPMTIITIPFSILIIIIPAFRLGLADDKHTSHTRTCTHYCVLSCTIIQNPHSNKVMILRRGGKTMGQVALVPWWNGVGT